MSKRTRRAVVLAAEQRAVDHAYFCLERARQVASELSGLDAAASGKDSIDARRTWERELASLDIAGKSLVFMRADVDEGEGRETFYVGRRLVRDQQLNPVVVSWSSQAAVNWRLTSEGDPGQVLLLRQIICDQQVVKRYLDLHGSVAEPPVGPAIPAAPGATATPDTAAEEPAWRDPLLEEMDRARDGSMHDIVETIQREQLRLVAEEPAGVLVIQGGPGTGKTAVGLHRITWLLDNKHRTAREILVIGPNRGFLDYVGVTLSELGSDDVSMLELPALWSAAASPRDPRPVAAVKADPRMAEVLRRAVDRETTSSAERLTALVGGPVFTFELNRREVVVPVEEIAGIAGAALAGDSPYQVRRERCVQWITQHLTEVYVGLLPGPADIDYLAETARARPVVRLLKRICPSLAAQDVLRGLFSGVATLSRAAEGILSAAEQDLLTAPRPGAGPGSRTTRSQTEPSREDLVLLDELEYVLGGRPQKVYRHLVVDEAQDVTPMEARALARRCPSGSMTVLGDLAQSTGPYPHQDWDGFGKVLAGRDGWRITQLLTGFRVPGEVMAFVARLGEHCAPGVAVPDSVRDTGTDVAVVQGAEAGTLAAAAVARLRASAANGADERSIGVIVPPGGTWASDMVRALGPESLGSLAVLTPAEAKGLEFDHVVVVEPAAIVAGESVGLRHLYVALTRCTQSLTVVHTLPLPPQIGGSDRLPASAPSPRDAEGSAADPGVSLCSRYFADGSSCTHSTHQADKWCRTAPCGGFRTAEPVVVAQPRRLAPLSGARDQGRLSLGARQRAAVRVSSGACGAFVARHRGGLREAAVELHAMLVPFVERARHLRAADGTWVLDLAGFRIVLSPEADTITGYDAAHAERSFAQFEAGVASRVGKDARATRRSVLTAAVRESGPPLDGEELVRLLDAEAVHATASACAGYERAGQIRGMADEAFVRAMRGALADDLRTADIELLETCVIVEGSRFQWRLSADGRSLFAVCEPGTDYRRPPAFHDSLPEPRRATMFTTDPAPQLVEDEQAEEERPAEVSRGLERLVAARTVASRADRSHEALRHRLLADLYESAPEVGESTFVDAWCTRADGTVLFDVLGSEECTYPSIRESVLHLMEVSHLRTEGQAEFLVIVLGGEPAEPWMADAVDGAFSVLLAWRAHGTWAGPGARHIVS
ncbi:UvrD-helicase domain-containing protein [Streptomyces liliifuscus]|uniref:AAA family ATPase n=1 Tax=Streptomyces liliifuscus TaxID=2797636 RepID=A0A7T7KZL4_9ACTN|nr:UvrD-helicase domain-containing protein [Streptomyces liliifuscus]QQM43675.1 AAA family ATPase [Streptomyces liliifuscus]